MSKTNRSDVPLTGIAIGAVALALVVLFAVLLPKAHGETSSSTPHRISLPASLPGGYLAADRTDAWKNAGAQVKGHEAELVGEVKDELTYGDKQLAKTAKSDYGNRIYLKNGQSIFFVQVFRTAGGAFSPGELSDPSKSSEGSSVQQLTKVGDSVCIVDGSVTSPGQIQPSSTQCQRSSDDFTVQVTSPGTAASDVAKVADLVFAKVR
ncbi:hypothetical protein [Nocardioides sp.]|uniref:hypothetical protein n=1 Tax=Nocardioides sp. TaxID=35761 RepID=UPI002C7A965B|nr:hypothetical protein [Nocardioides sp.]HVX55835.1 hypothetical protein [Nocardioides sp.]